MDVLERLGSWLRAGEPAALATIIGVERKAPRGPGAAMAVGPKGEIVGSLSGGCVEGAVVESATEVMTSGTPRVVAFGITDDQAFDIGLSCGGTLQVLVEPLRAEGNERQVVDALEAVVAVRRAAAVVTVIAGGPRAGAKLFVPEDAKAPLVGSSGDAALDGKLVAAARDCLARGASERTEVGGADVFVHSLCPRPTLYVIGAVHPAAELCKAGKLVGFRIVVVDPRSPFATEERLPDADEIAREWPDGYLARQPIGARDAVCVLTHDLKFDVPAIRAALRAGAGYVGAMGSKKTQARRVEHLREEGVAAEDLARVFSPIGLDIGGDEGGEIAVSIVAEIVANRNRKSMILRAR